jgi:hypothetical protein
MIEKEIETHIIAALAALNLPGLDIRGAWQPSAAGEVKDEESDGAPASLYVRVGQRSFADYSSPEVTFPVTLSFVLRTDLNPTGSALETYCDPVANLLQGWNIDLNSGRDICELDTRGFKTHFIQFTGGNGPTFESESNLWAVTFDLTVGGSVSPTQPSTENQ